MKVSVLVLAGALSALAFAAQAAPTIKPVAPASDGLVQQARVSCAYLTPDGYCVRPRKHYKKPHRQHWRYHRPVYRTYDPQPDDYWSYERPRPLIPIMPNYGPFYGDGWDNSDD